MDLAYGLCFAMVPFLPPPPHHTPVLFLLLRSSSFITMNGTQYSGSTGPQNVQMSAGESFAWFADYSAYYDGW